MNSACYFSIKSIIERTGTCSSDSSVPSVWAAVKTSSRSNLFICSRKPYLLHVSRAYSTHAVDPIINCLVTVCSGCVEQTGFFTISVFVNLSIECLHCKKKQTNKQKKTQYLLLTFIQTRINLCFQSPPVWSRQLASSVWNTRAAMIVVQAAKGE